MPLPFLPKKNPACPFCYQRLDLSQVAFRCSGLAAPGRPSCGVFPDPVYAAEFGDSTPQRPVIAEIFEDGSFILDERKRPRLLRARSSQTCERCGGRSQERTCPHCHSRLPVNLDQNSPMIGLVGAPYAGKTVLLSVLQYELTHGIARRFGASIDSLGGHGGLAGELESNRQAMGRDSILPGKTAATGRTKKQPAVYEWRYRNRGKDVSTIFSLYDNAGEDVAHARNALDQTYLAAADSVILLLDPFSFPENLHLPGRPQQDRPSSPEEALDAITTVLQTVHGVQSGKRIKQPLAVVIPKIDAFFDRIPSQSPLLKPASDAPYFDEQESLDIHDHVASLVEDWGGDNLLRKLQHNYENYRLFGVSALGAEPDYGTARVNERGVLPHRVAEPLLWLMAQRGFIPKEER